MIAALSRAALVFLGLALDVRLAGAFLSAELW